MIDPQLLLVQPPVKDITTNVNFPADIPCDGFFSWIYATMNLDPMVAELGWKSNNKLKKTPVHHLKTHDDVNEAFKVLGVLLSNTHHCKPTWMGIIHLNTAPVETSKSKKTDGNHITDFAYADELHLVKEKLCCAEHGGLNHWCYVHPNTPGEHVTLGLEEITLWARKIGLCYSSRNTLSHLDTLAVPIQHTPGPCTHVHVRSNASLQDISSSSSGKQHLLTPPSDESDSKAESIPVTDILCDLHQKHPKLNYLQYEPTLATKGIVYANTAKKCFRL
ncbi:hypothetical protein L208DRAFT_1426324 [Tricholoma matsutake]|nr:hypothetical protein L208DRAFT_1426324 [Tricholoma matsutake 945]